MVVVVLVHAPVSLFCFRSRHPLTAVTNEPVLPPQLDPSEQPIERVPHLLLALIAPSRYAHEAEVFIDRVHRRVAGRRATGSPARFSSHVVAVGAGLVPEMGHLDRGGGVDGGWRARVIAEADGILVGF